MPSNPYHHRATARQKATLPISNNDLRRAHRLSAWIALLTALASISGILLPNRVYPTSDLREHFLANDVVTLFFGLPLLLGSMWLACRRGRLVGLLLWPGALSFGIYNYLIYLLGMPFNGLIILFFVIVILSIHAFVGLLAAINCTVVKERLIGLVYERVSAGVMIGLGILIIPIAIGGIAKETFSDASEISRPDIALHVADLLISSIWIVCGSLLWQWRPLGYVVGLGILFQGSMLFVGLLVLFLLQPLLTGAAFASLDFFFVSVMGLICFVPFFRFLRGVIKSRW